MTAFGVPIAGNNVSDVFSLLIYKCLAVKELPLYCTTQQGNELVAEFDSLGAAANANLY
jgi:hypothetical protein